MVPERHKKKYGSLVTFSSFEMTKYNLTISNEEKVTRDPYYYGSSGIRTHASEEP